MSGTEEPKKEKDILLQGYHTARAWSSLIVSLSTGVIVFTAIFKRDIAHEGQALQSTCVLISSWILLGIAIIAGVMYLGSLISQLNKGQEKQLQLYAGMPRTLALIQWVAFLLGLVGFGYFAVANLL